MGFRRRSCCRCGRRRRPGAGRRPRRRVYDRMAASGNASVTGEPAALPAIVFLTTRRKILFASVAFLLFASSTVAGCVALDVYARHRARGLGLNAWGYRGPAIGRKQPGEARIAAPGGSTVFGYGVAWTDAWPFYLERRIKASRHQRPQLANLGMPRDSAATFAATLDDYAYLKCD